MAIPVAFLLFLMDAHDPGPIEADPPPPIPPTHVECWQIHFSGRLFWGFPEVTPTTTIPGYIQIIWRESSYDGLILAELAHTCRSRVFTYPTYPSSATITGIDGTTTTVPFRSGSYYASGCGPSSQVPGGTDCSSTGGVVATYTEPLAPIRFSVPRRCAIYESGGVDQRSCVGGTWNVEPPKLPILLSDLEIVSEPAQHGTYAIGKVIRIKATFPETIEVLAVPSAQVAIGEKQEGRILVPDVREATYEVPTDGSTTTSEMYFRYTVQEDDLDETGVSLPENPVTAVVRKLGNPLLYVPIHPGLQSDASHKVDGVRPTISGLQFDPSVFNALKTADAHYNIELVATFSEDVSVSGDPGIGITVNGTAATSTYQGPSGTGLNKRFRHQLARSSDSSETSTTTSVAVPAGSVALDSNDSVKDLVGNDAVLDYSALRALSMTAFDRTGPALEGLTIEGNTNRYGWLRICKVKRRFSPPHLFQGCEKLNNQATGSGFVDVVATFDEVITQTAHNNAELDVLLDGGATSTTEIVLNSSIVGSDEINSSTS